MRVIIVDNEDSFTWNVVHFIAKHSESCPQVISYKNFKMDDVALADWIVLSPGPGSPSEYPKYKLLFDTVNHPPILGICLGLQIINEYFGGESKPLRSPMHGRSDFVFFEGRTYSVARYHSLFLASIGTHLEVLMSNREGIPMAVGHKKKPILGYQFHPESFLTKEGSFFLSYAADFFNSHR